MRTIPIHFRVARSGFSLVEIIAVISLLLLIMALAVPVVTGVLKASKLSSASNAVVDQLTLARQIALARSCRVEVRFYELPEAGGGKAYFGLSTYLISEIGVATPLGKMRELPRPIVISQASDQNTIFRNADMYKGTEDLPRVAAAPYYKFSFFPSGRTDFDPGTNWFMTLCDGKAGPPTLGKLLPNYAVLQIDSFTGHVRVYRP